MKFFLILYLLWVYKGAFRHIKKINDFCYIDKYLFDRCLSQGICSYCRNLLGINICSTKWVVRNSSVRGSYWYKPPFRCNSPSEIKESLQVRIAILRKELFKL